MMHIKPRILTALVLGVYSAASWAMHPFVVRDIRVEGIQRTEPGTVFSYLPVKVGQTMTDAKAEATIKALYATGFFRDVEVEHQGDVLVIVVQEQPAIADIEISGNKEFKTKDLTKALSQIGLSKGRIFDRSMLERAELELRQEYYSRGKYGVAITTTVTPLARNRVSLSFAIDEGPVAKIRQITVVGNHAYHEKTLLDLFTLTTPGWFTWITKDDQYSKQKLEGDLEKLRSFYLDNGYLAFRVNSTQVSITPDKTAIYITVNITEGAKYTVSGVSLAGKTVLPRPAIEKLIKIKPGQVFSQKLLTQSTKAIGDALADKGYAFANVNAVPKLDPVKHVVSFTFMVDPGRRVYVRRINITGNEVTRDEVIRREMRQMEGGLYSAKKINLSRQRLNRLGYFSDVNVETPAVPGKPDQVDLDVNVKERPTGSIMLGAGYSSTDGVILSGSISKQNVFGSGNAVDLQISTGQVNSVYSLSYTNPYYTPDGVSLGYDIYKRNVDASYIGTIADYTSKTLGADVRLGVPLNEIDTINWGLGYEWNQLGVFADSPPEYIDFVNQFGSSNTTLRGSVGWQRDTRNSAIFPTKGNLQSVYVETGLPGGTLKYYKINYQDQWFHPITSDFTLMLNGQLGYGNGFNGKPLPFFKNFYVGGNTTVRGYQYGTLGPKDVNGNAIGGNESVIGNAELFFPMPGLAESKSVRMSVFLDGGGSWGPGDYLGRYSKFSVSDLRYSSGVALTWLSPIGPLKFSVGKPLNPKPGDQTQTFQFLLGSVF